jgi:hypothetical protein
MMELDESAVPVLRESLEYSYRAVDHWRDRTHSDPEPSPQLVAHSLNK